MSIASSSSSVLRSSLSAAKACDPLPKLRRPKLTCSSDISSGLSIPADLANFKGRRTYAAPAFAQQSSEQPSPSIPSYRDRTPSPSHSNPDALTPLSAQNYLSDLLHLSPTRAFPPPLALQILTHKSYRYAHSIRSPLPLSQSQSQSNVAHNARLSFLGRRALASYLAMFIHSSYRSETELRASGLLSGKSGLEEKLESLRHVNNLGREVGQLWDVAKVMRWDQNEVSAWLEDVEKGRTALTSLEISQNSRAEGSLKVKGMTVEAILGGIYTQFGSPAAHRTFHLHVLPTLSPQLRDAKLIEKVERMREDLEKEYGGGILRP
ncbi:hypothetical protein P7C73_g870, partial [Tremellales sp. Uapishka_1]